MKPHVEPLAYWRRKVIFILLVIAFLLCLPAFMFYATGYRYDIFSGKPTITATGALYISADVQDGSIYIDEAEVTNARVFRNASYIQGLEPNMHRVHVQAPGMHTWVKNLSVYPHIVTEAEAFNLPLVPQVRVVTEYQTIRGEAVFMVGSSTAPVLPASSSSVPFVVATSTATSSYRVNSEYALLLDLFEEKASTTKARALMTERFGFSTSTTPVPDMGTTTVTRNNIALFESKGEVYAQALGTGRQIPHYFCTNQVEIDINLDEPLPEVVPLSDGELFFEETLDTLSNNTRECRETIVIDRKGETVIGFDFFPGNDNLVLMHLTSGLYVVEIDDRSWQNMQPLYLGTNLEMFVYGSSIFVKEGKYIFEVLPEIAG